MSDLCRNAISICIGIGFGFMYMAAFPPNWPGHPIVALVGVVGCAITFAWIALLKSERPPTSTRTD